MTFFYNQLCWQFQKLIITLFIVISLCFNVLVYAITPTNESQEKPETFTPKEPLTIAINKTSYPYHASNDKGEAIGIMPDLWRLWAKKQQTEIKFEVFDWADTLNQVISGNVDIHGGLSITESRRKTLLFSDPLFLIHTNFYINQKLSSITNISDLQPYSIGAIKGTANLESLTLNHPELSLKIYDTRAALYQAALNNEVLVFTVLERIVDDSTVDQSIKKRFPRHKLLVNQRSQYGIAVTKYSKTEGSNTEGFNTESNAPLLAFIEAGFDKITDDEREVIENKWTAKSNNKEKLKVVFSPHYSPYLGLSLSGEPQGLLIDVWRYWAEHLGVNVEFFAQDFVDGLNLITEKKADILLALPDNFPVNENIAMAAPIYEPNGQIFISHKIRDLNGDRILSLLQLENRSTEYVFGLWDKSNFKKDLFALYPKLNVRYFKSINSMLNAAERGEISGFIGLADLIQANLVEANLQALFYRVEKAILPAKLVPIVHKENEKLLKRINTGFSELDMKSLMKIESRWLKDEQNHFYYKEQANKVLLTQEESHFIADHGKIKLGILKKLSPIEFVSNEGEFLGINKDIIEIVADRTGLKFETVPLDNWHQLYQALINNEIDMLGNITPTSERETLMQFSDTYWEMPWVIVHSQLNGRKTNLKDFNGKTLAIVKGYYLIKIIRKEYPLINLKTVENREQAVKALEENQIDGFVTPMATASYILKQEEVTTLTLSVMDDFVVEKSHFAVSNQEATLKGILNKGLATITEDEKQAIYNKWFSLEIKTGLDKRKVIKAALEIGLVIIIVFVVFFMWNRSLKAEIKRREKLEKTMKHMATHDELTGLANRVLLNDRLSTAIKFHKRQSLKMAVLFIDLDGFKNINDTYGHDVGDELLQQVAQRLLGCVRSSDTVVRFGGDEFVLLLTGLNDNTQASNVAEKVLTLMQKEFELSQTSASIGCSIGIAMFPDDADNDIDLIKIADTLMYKVKDAGKNHYMFN